MVGTILPYLLSVFCAKRHLAFQEKLKYSKDTFKSEICNSIANELFIQVHEEEIPLLKKYERRRKRVSEKEEYEVIKFVERGTDCYIISDYVEGITLYRWIQLHEEIEKTILEKWIRELIRQLDLFHKQKDSSKYTHLNPYTIIVMQDEKIALLSLEEKIPCLKGKFAKQFQLENPNQDIDLYCLGRTIQFIMAHTKCVPYLRKREEIKLLTFVKKCLKNTHKKQFVKCNRKQVKKILVMLGMIFFIISIIFLPKKEEKKFESDVNYFDLGTHYFLKEKDYAKSIMYFEKAKEQGKCSVAYVKLSNFMLNKIDVKEIKKSLQIIEKEADGENNIEKKLMLARGYILVDMDWAYEKIVEMYLDNFEKISEEMWTEWNEYKALAYEKLSLWKEAGTQYRILNEQEKKRNEKEKMYKEKLMEMDICYLRELWKEEEFSIEEKYHVLQNMLKDNPQIKKNEFFIRFVQENQIQF